MTRQDTSEARRTDAKAGATAGIPDCGQSARYGPIFAGAGAMPGRARIEALFLKRPGT